MSSLPRVTKDENGMPIMVGVKERKLTQQQADYSDTAKALEMAQGIDGYNARQAFANHPEASPGLITSLVGAGAGPNNTIVATLAAIDAQTKAKRAEDARVASAKLSTERFEKTPQGWVWGKLKSAVRTAAIAGDSITQTFNAAFRQGVVGVEAGLEGIKQNFTGAAWGTPRHISVEPSASLQAKMDVLPDNPIEGIAEQTTIGQVFMDLAKGNKVDLGSGFFASEQSGAGFAAREASLKYNKQKFIVNGQTYYRPYSFMDPLSQVVAAPFGQGPESGTVRVINALGEISFSIFTDPLLGYSKIASALREAKLLAETADGIKAAKAAVDVTVLSAQLEEANRAIEASFEAMNLSKNAAKEAAAVTRKKSPRLTGRSEEYRAAQEEFNASRDLHKAAWDKFNPLTDEFNNININYNDIAKFLSGASGTHVLDALANADTFLEVQKLAKGKFTVDEAVALSKATTREEVLAALAPYIANGTLAARTLETGTRTSRALKAASASVEGNKVVSGAAKTVKDAFGTVITPGDRVAISAFFKGAQARAVTRMPFSEKIVEVAHDLQTFGRKYKAYLPERGGSLIHTGDKDKLIETVNNVGRFMNLPKIVLDKLITDIALAPTTTESGFLATGKLFDAIYAHHAADLLPEQLDAFREITRVFETSRNEMSKYWASQHATGANIEFGLIGGESVTLHSSHLDSELLNAFVYIPDAKEISDFLKQAKRFGQARLSVDETMSNLNNLWKKSVMVRPAYIARNIIEEQIRVYGVGHISFFNRPGAALAMWLGRDGGPQWKSFLNKYDELRHDVFRQDFKLGSSAEEFAAEELAGNLINPYLSFMSDSNVGGSSDGAITKLVRSLGYTSEKFGHPLWWQGYASQMRVLHNSEFVRKVIATKPGDEMTTVAYFLEGEGRPTLDKFIRFQDDQFKDFVNTKEGLMQYLFNGVNKEGQQVSVLARIEELAGRGQMAPLIKQLLLKGSIKVGDTAIVIPNGKTIAEHALKVSAKGGKLGKSSKVKADLNKEFSEVLEKHFGKGGDWTDVEMTLPSRTSQVGADTAKTIEERINGFAASFFDKAVEFEKTTTMGPEWRQSYWDKIAEISHALDAESVAKLQEMAPESLGTLRDAVSRKVIGTNHKAWRTLEKAKGNGPLNLEDAHQFATNAANKKVTELFYNAQKRNLLFHQLRLIAPFAQAWEDTIKSWSRIALDNPEQVYKVAKLSDWSTKSGSSALYELTDAKSIYDPNQGIFYSDPQTGERKFFVPFASSALNVLQGILPGASDPRTTGPYAFSATPQSFNFALGGGSILPGMGFGVTWGVGLLSAMNKNPLKILPPALEEEIYKIAFPYGTPDVKNAGWMEGPLFTANWVRILGAVAGAEKTYAAAFAPSMGYLASSGEYDLNDPADQARLARDGDNLGRYFTMWRGIMGAMIPIPFAMRPEALARSKDGYTVLATSVFADFKNLEVEAGGNKNKAYADFLDLYGPEQIFAITRTTTGYEPTNLPTYAMIKEDPSVLSKYGSVYGYFYPNGELSKVLYEFQQQRGSFGKMSAKEIMEKATNIRYAAAKDRLATRAMAENWSSSQIQSANASLTESYLGRGRVAPKVDTQWFDRAIVQLKAAADDPNLADSNALAGARAYLIQRDKAIAAAGTKTLKAQAATAQRAWLAEEALKLITKYPEFQKVYYGIFKRELEGK